MKVRIAGVTVTGPGLPDWQTARAVFSGQQPWVDTPTSIGVPSVLSPRELRRASPLVRLALNAAEAACADAGMKGDIPVCIFASALGDGDTANAILNALCEPEKLVSPTHFHNSVHNVAVGYWSQGVQSHTASTSLAAGDATFGAGLLKAMMTVTRDHCPALLVAVDHPFPAPLNTRRPLAAAFATGFVFVPDDGVRGPTVSLTSGAEGAATAPRLAALHRIWHGCPAARALPILEGLVNGGTVVVEASKDYFITLTVSP
ncbi:MAG: beta-ketoacyl synthase chain length factor [Rhodospirillales bacterium]